MMLGDYPYLVVSLGLVALALFLIVVLRQHRSLLLVSGALACPLALLSGQFIPEYWNPRVVFHLVTSPEDVLFSASMGVIALALTLIRFRGRLRWRIEWSVVLRRFALCLVVCIGIHLILMVTVFERHQVMYSMAIALLCLSVLLVALRPGNIPVALLGAVTFPAFYLGVVKVAFVVFPSGAKAWIPRAQLPVEVLAIPAFEFGWAIGWGLTWAPMVWYACDVRAADLRPALAAYPAPRSAGPEEGSGRS